MHALLVVSVRPVHFLQSPELFGGGNRKWGHPAINEDNQQKKKSCWGYHKGQLQQNEAIAGGYIIRNSMCTRTTLFVWSLLWIYAESMPVDIFTIFWNWNAFWTRSIEYSNGVLFHDISVLYPCYPGLSLLPCLQTKVLSRCIRRRCTTW